MAYIDTKTFDIYSEIEGVSEIYSLSFECDDLIAPIIAMLNRKGYKTMACCAGHPYTGKDYVYSVYEGKEFEPTYSVEELTEEVLSKEEDDTKELVEELSQDGKKVYRHLVGTVPHEAYIYFARTYFTSNDQLPLGWYVDKDSIRYSFDPKLEPYFFMANQVAVYMTLYDWARKLPYRSKVNQPEW